MRRGRLAGIAALSMLIAPGMWWRSAPVVDQSHAVRFVAQDAATPASWPAGLTLAQAWHLDAANSEFAGFSALVPDGPGFRAFSDFGLVVRLPHPAPQTARIAPEALPRALEIAATPDVEAAQFDAASGTLWLSYEHHNAIRRIDAAGASAFAYPPVLQGLGDNSGVEAMMRLPDGAFVMLGERGGQGFLFAGDPLDTPRAVQFSVDYPPDYRPTDMALLPDGRALVLLRAMAWGYPPVSSKLMIGDPAAIREGQAWALTPLATIDQPGLRENYEGLVVEPASDGALTLWLISDNNRAVLQRTLLLKLRWLPESRTPESQTAESQTAESQAARPETQTAR